MAPRAPSTMSTINLGRLKGNIGDQNYELPADRRSHSLRDAW